jgi:Family of unknown function (DUF6006)
MKMLNSLFQQSVLGIALIPLGILLTVSAAPASQVAAEWIFGHWDCQIDGRSAKMQWQVVNDSQTNCQGDGCSTTSGVKVMGWFSDNGGAWVPLAKRYTRGNDVGIRALLIMGMIFG